MLILIYIAIMRKKAQEVQKITITEDLFPRCSSTNPSKSAYATFFNSLNLDGSSISSTLKDMFVLFTKLGNPRGIIIRSLNIWPVI